MDLGLKARAAHVSGVLQVLLGIGVLAEVGRRFFYGSEAQSGLMLGIGGLALVANLAALALLAKHRNGEVHMRASWMHRRVHLTIHSSRNRFAGRLDSPGRPLSPRG